MRSSFGFKFLLVSFTIFVCSSAFAWQRSARHSGVEEYVGPYGSSVVLDSTFGTDGTVSNLVTGGDKYDDWAECMAIQSDGKIVAAGYTSVYNHDAFAIVRYDTDGTPDNTFGTDGSVITHITQPYGWDDDIRSIAIQPDGKIVAGGTTTDHSFISYALARYNPDGSLDSTFGTGGIVKDYIFGSDTIEAEGNCIAIQPDGKILISGGSSNGTNHTFALVRYNPNGTPDSTFGNDGVAASRLPKGNNTNDFARVILVQPDGKIIVGGYPLNLNYRNFLLARYNADGSLDSTFGTNGSVENFIAGGGKQDDEINSMVLEPDGKIIAAGFTLDGSGHYACALARYNENGTLDNTFGTNGTATAYDSTNNIINSIYVQPDGKIVAAGDCWVFSPMVFLLARFNQDGTLDDSFGTHGFVSNYIAGGDSTNDRAYAIGLEPDGKIVAAGFSSTSMAFHTFAVARYVYRPYPTPILTSPADGSANVSPSVVLKVDSIAYALGYHWQVSGDPSFSTTVVDDSTSGAADTVNSVNLSAGTQYYWRVSALYPGGSSEYPPTETFTTANGVNSVTEGNGTPKSYALDQNYPNPFNPATMISYQIPVNSRVTLKVYDVLGRRVSTLVDGDRLPGKYDVKFDGRKLASGVYFYRITAKSLAGNRRDFVKVRKLLLTK